MRRNGVFLAPVVKRAVSAVASGRTMTSVAGEIGAHRETVSKWCSRAGHISLRHPTELRERVVEAVANGRSMHGAAAYFGVPYATVYWWCCRAGERRAMTRGRGPMYSAAIREQAIAMRATGARWSDIGQAVGAPWTTVRGWVERAASQSVEERAA